MHLKVTLGHSEVGVFLFLFVLRTNSNPLALCLYVQICRKYQTRKGFAYLAAKRSRYCGSAEMCEHSEKRNYNSIFDPRTAFPYLFAARDTICSDYACCTACTYHLLARQYTAFAVCTLK